MEDYTVGDTNGRMIFFDVSEDVNQIELYRRDFTVPANTDHIFDFSMTTMYDIDTNLCPGTGVPSRPGGNSSSWTQISVYVIHRGH